MIDVRIETQNAEFEALKDLAEQFRRLSMTAVVEDDYPSVRTDYEKALATFLAACESNGRRMRQ